MALSKKGAMVVRRKAKEKASRHKTKSRNFVNVMEERTSKEGKRTERYQKAMKAYKKDMRKD